MIVDNAIEDVVGNKIQLMMARMATMERNSNLRVHQVPKSPGLMGAAPGASGTPSLVKMDMSQPPPQKEVVKKVLSGAGQARDMDVYTLKPTLLCKTCLKD